MSPLPTPLVSASELREGLAGARHIRVIEASFDLARPDAGEAQWREARIPGSGYLHLDRDLSGPKTGRNGRHPLPTRSAFAATLGRAGVTPASFVVALDRQGGVYAARLWWMLRWMGHAQVAVLDGGLDGWIAAGGSLDREAPAMHPAGDTPYPFNEPLVRQIDADALGNRLAALSLLDARAPERFRGEVEPLDAQAGHIPGALNRFFKDNLDAQGCFKPADQLRQDFLALIGARQPAEVVHSCGSGVTACHNLLAMEAAGLSGSVLYPGSWSEWSSDPARAVARG
jgi:thiosulfate/3-mercaptopyruvate sulfurtransferase